MDARETHEMKFPEQRYKYIQILQQKPKGKGLDIWEEVIKPEDKELLEAGTDSSSGSQSPFAVSLRPSFFVSSLTLFQVLKQSVCHLNLWPFCL